ncbi:MAG: hypothetical protein WC787_05260 [Patescibacteria group bacterium]|jgi:uncharacterized membrane protein YkgB
MNIRQIDRRIINAFRLVSPIVSKLAFFLVFFWFGVLKVLDLSPAHPMVGSLLAKTMPFMQLEPFMVLFGLFEMLIGLLFLIPRAERVVFPLLAFHLITTLMPLVLLPSVAWSAPFTPTLEGQYMIKNIVIIALAMAMVADMKPLPRPSSRS